MMGDHGSWAGPEAPVSKFHLTLWKSPWPVGMALVGEKDSSVVYRLPLCLRAWLPR